MVATRPKTRAERIELSDRAMYRATIKLLARDGPDSMTLAKIGKEAGYTGGLVSYRFGSKLGLLKAVCEHILNLLSQQVLDKAKNEGAIGIEGIREMTEIYLDAVEKKSDLMLALFSIMNVGCTARTELSPIFEEFDNRLRRQMAETIEKGKQAGEVSTTLDSEAFAIAYLGMLRGTALQYFTDADLVDLQRTKASIIECCKRTFRSDLD